MLLVSCCNHDRLQLELQQPSQLIFGNSKNKLIRCLEKFDE